MAVKGSTIAGGVGGAAMGAGTGAQIGTAFAPGFGTAVGAGVGALVGGLAGAYAAHKAGEIDDSQLKRMEEIAARIESEYELPSDQVTPISLEEYRLIGQYAPAIAKYVEEQEPQRIQESGSQREISAQRDVLAKLGQLSTTGDDAISRAAREEAIFESDAANKSRKAGILRDAASRGFGGSGNELLAQLNSSEADAQNARKASLSAASGAESRKLQALSQMGNMAGQIRNQNANVERANVEAMNSFRQRLTQGRNQQAQRETDTLNNAQMVNMDRVQSNSNSNVALRNSATVANKAAAEAAKENLRREKNNRLLAAMGRQEGIAGLESAAAQNRLNTITSAIGATANAGVSAAGAYQRSNDRKEDNDFRERELDIREKEAEARRARRLNNPTFFNDDEYPA